MVHTEVRRNSGFKVHLIVTVVTWPCRSAHKLVCLFGNLVRFMVAKFPQDASHQNSPRVPASPTQNYWIHATLRRDAAGSLARLGAVRSNRSTRSRTSKSSRSRKSRSSHGSHDDPERLIIGKITAGMVVASERTSQYCILPTIVAFFSEHVFKIF